MTLCSYLLSNKEDQQYREPELLNTLIDRSRHLPDAPQKETHPSGWVAHYAVGSGFVLAYKVLWPASLKEPTLGKTLLIGGLSGAIGILVWKILFTIHRSPPRNNRSGYYRQLFFAHLIFTSASVYTFKYFEPVEAPAIGLAQQFS